MDAFAIERCGVPSATLMERAGSGAAEIVRERFPHVRKTGVVVVVGKGNNGGDGFVLARALKRHRIRCEIVLTVPRSDITGTARAKMLAWQRSGGRTHAATATNLGALPRSFRWAGCVVDAVFGTGIRGEVTGVPAEVINLVNASGLPTVALDIPSGLDADRGVPLGVAIQAELTVAFAAPKLGTIVFPGARYAGALAVVDIGMPAEAIEAVAPTMAAVDATAASTLMWPRDPEGHKGTHGHVAIIAGARGKTGAAVLAARGAARAGAGLVTVGCPARVQPEVAARLLEEMTRPLPDDIDGGFAFEDAAPYMAAIAGKDAVLAGPGMGVSPDGRALVRWLVEHTRVPLVLDADALSCLATDGAPASIRRNAALILTPHPGEMARLCGRTTSEVQDDRLAVARMVAAERGAVVVLKGARTITATPDGRVWINLSGNPGLGSGGTGDVLGGIIVSLLAQGHPADEAARLGVFLHGAAADEVAARRGSIGMIASDVIDGLPPVAAGLLAMTRDA